MRVFLASGVIGTRLIPLLRAAGHDVAGMTRTPAKAERLKELGAEPVVCDVFDRDALRDAVRAFGPDLMMHQLTDLPDDHARFADHADANAWMRREGTRNLLAAAQAADTPRFIAQSIAWQIPGGRGGAVHEHERAVLDAGGVIIRYGQLYGPGTYYETEPPAPPRVHVDDAARRTLPVLEHPSGVLAVTDDDHS